MAGRPPGQPKSGGRVAGTPNRVTKTLADQCVDKGIDPWAKLLEHIQSDDAAISLKAISEACSYLYPKRKALEISDERDIKLAERAKELRGMPQEEKIKLIEQRLKLIKGKG